MDQRIEYIIGMYQRIYPDMVVTPETMIKGTSIKKLCEFPGPGYYRVVRWCEEKLKTLPAKQLAENDMDRVKEQFRKAFEIMKGRNVKYGTSWKVLTISSIANLCEMKLNRIAQMNNQNLDPKIEDELIDTMNYMAFALIKYQEQKTKIRN